ncbi:MAG: flagellar hook assembly protein FlgD [Sphingobium sp.]
MTTTTATNPAYGSAASLASKKASGVSQQSIMQTDFLTLLTAQLKTQDPFNPTDNADLVAQMATISNTSGIAEMNQALQRIEATLSGTRLGDAASWIGHSMLVTSNLAAPNARGDYAGQITLGQDETAVSVDFVDGSGATVHSIDLGAQKAGDVPFYWDGTDGQGNYIAGQTLQVKVRGAAPTNVATWASIAAVQSPADGTASKLITPLGSFSPDQALKLT